VIDPDLPRRGDGKAIKPAVSEPPPPEPWFEGVRQCSRRAKGRPGQRCPNEALPMMKVCGYHYGARLHNTARADVGVYAAMFTNPVMRERYKHLQTDPELRAIRAEIAAARTLLEQSLVSVDVLDAAEIEKRVRMLEVVTRMVQRDHDIESIKRLSWDLEEIRLKAMMLAHAVNQILRDFPFQRQALLEQMLAIFADAGVANYRERLLMGEEDIGGPVA
jgi:hypothetical protein